MRYRLRTLLILLAVLPSILGPLGAWGWRKYAEWHTFQCDHLAATAEQWREATRHVKLVSRGEKSVP